METIPLKHIQAAIANPGNNIFGVAYSTALGERKDCIDFVHRGMGKPGAKIIGLKDV